MPQLQRLTTLSGNFLDRKTMEKYDCHKFYSDAIL